MSFMQPQITHEHFQIIETTKEGTIVTPEVCAEYPGNDDAAKAYDVEPSDVSIVFGWGARLSAPGFMDCTEWVVFDTKKEAAEHLLEMFEDGFDDDEIQALKEVGIGHIKQ